MPGFLGGSSSGSGTSGEIRFPAELIDPVTKLRVSEPQTMMDTDFEYGLQPTKWETVELINNTPSFFSASGDTTIPNLLDVTTTAGSREVKVTTALPHGLAVGIPINVTGSKSLTADGAYIINSVPDTTTFTYLCKQNQLTTASIVDLYTSIITGQFFQGSQIKISDSEGIITNASAQSTLTVKTDSPHGFGVNTPFYFLNLNSTVSQEFDSSNTGAKSFDSSNTATAQSFDGSNTLTSYSFDLNNKGLTGGTVSNVVSTNISSDTVTVTHTSENFVGKRIGTPLYYNVSAASGYFATTPRGIVYLASIDLLGASSSEFKVSATPGGPVLDLTVTVTGTFQLANQSLTFAGSTVDSGVETTVALDTGSAVPFDGANSTGTVLTSVTFSNGSAIIQATNAAGSSVDTGMYVRSMVKYTTTGTAAGGLTADATYWLTFHSIIVAPAPGLIQFKLTSTVGGSDIVISSQGSGTHSFRQIGVSTDKDALHIRSHGFVSGDMVKYAYPSGGAITRQSFTKDYMFVTVLDADNFALESDVGLQATSTGTVSTISVAGTSYKLHRFVVTTNRTTRAHTFTVTAGNAVADYLVVGGGGGGGQYVGGGGGGGGFIEGTVNLSPGTYTLSVGGGASGGDTCRDNTWGNGAASSISGNGVSIIAAGGGRGGNYPDNGQGATTSGGSGGGAGGPEGGGGQGGGVTAGTFTGVLTGASFGFRGGNGAGTRAGTDTTAKGGGGAGGAGIDSIWSEPGDAGNGRQSSITGTSYYYAGGGGGGGYYPGSNGSSSRAGNGGLGGGGMGGAMGSGQTGSIGTGGEANGNVVAFAGANPRGLGAGEGAGGDGGFGTGGGGGGSGHSCVGGDGGSGIIYIRYKG
jgi:hypothetical protein